MKKRTIVILTVVIIIAVSGVSVLYYIAIQGLTTGPLLWINVGLSDPVRMDERLWAVEVENVTGYHDSIHENVNQFDISLMKGDLMIIPLRQLRNGFVANSNNTYIFFEDNGQIGRLDAGDAFYLVGLDTSSSYEFRLVFRLDGWTSFAFVQT